MKKHILIIEESKFRPEAGNQLTQSEMGSLKGGEVCICDANPFDIPCLCNVNPFDPACICKVNRFTIGCKAKAV